MILSLALILLASMSRLDVPVGSWDHVAKGAPDGVCQGLANSHQCALAVERYRLRSAGSAVVRDGESLRISLANGDTATFSNELGTGGRWYTYVDELPSGHHLVHVQFYEGGEYLLVDRRTGDRLKLREYPSFSPDGAYVVTVDPTDVESLSLRVEIWKLGPRASLVWHGTLEHADQGYGYTWLSPTEILVVRRTEGGKAYRECIQKSREKWVIGQCRPDA